ncbi:hypothetical protein ZWY2020_001522 [Hordeum vulgare]|nr:hypothetical protein ZWY2020_001522 [Hordeum vulgare]
MEDMCNFDISEAHVQFARNRVIVPIPIQIKGTFSSSQLGDSQCQAHPSPGLMESHCLLCFRVMKCCLADQSAKSTLKVSISDNSEKNTCPKTVAFMCIHHSASSRPFMKSVLRFMKVDSHLNRCEDLNSQSSTFTTRDSEDLDGLHTLASLMMWNADTCRLPWSGEI